MKTPTEKKSDDLPLFTKPDAILLDHEWVFIRNAECDKCEAKQWTLSPGLKDDEYVPLFLKCKECGYKWNVEAEIERVG